MKNKIRTIKYKPGFTLIELIFATTIIAMMFTIIISTFIGVLRFYNWSSTTRNNQESTRQLTDIMTRLINSKKIGYSNGDSLCLLPANLGTTEKTVKLYLEDAQVKYQEYSLPPNLPGGITPPVENYCNDSEKVGGAIGISNPDTSITSLEFELVSGSNEQIAKKSTTIKITSVNGSSAVCFAGDNFCDQTEFATAANEI